MHSRNNSRDHVRQGDGPDLQARPVIRFTEALPKTRSGKIMRRLLRDIAAGNEIKQDTTTLEDRTIVDKLVAQGG